MHFHMKTQRKTTLSYEINSILCTPIVSYFDSINSTKFQHLTHITTKTDAYNSHTGQWNIDFHTKTMYDHLKA